MLAYAQASRTMTVYREDGSFEIVDLLLVTGLEVSNGQGGQGHTRRRKSS